MRKVILILLTIASIMLLTVGCSNQTTADPNSKGTEASYNKSSITTDVKYEDLIPDPSEFFSEKASTVSNDAQCWYQIKNCTVENFDNYVSECKTMGFTNIHNESDNGTLKLFFAYDIDNKYYLEASLDHSSSQVNINVSPVKNNS